MKKFVGLILSLFLVSCCVDLVLAGVAGDCVNCHTMHNSQGGSLVLADGPSESLLNDDCIGCHSRPDAETIGSVGSSRVPIVYSLNEPTNPLAGGNFYWVVASGDGYGHNVFGIVGQDSNLTMAPGGDVGFAAIESCAKCHAALENGCRSCHWPRHHAAGDANGIADQADGWYRFLGSAMDADDPSETGTDPTAAPGVIGIEEADWEQSPSSTVHNVYKGTSSSYSSSYYPKENSIGSFCSGCHENFHTNMLGGPPIALGWIRHPSDVVLPSTGEYADYTTYNPLAPVAKQTLDGTVPSTIDHDSDLVTCLSCHRAHGSPYQDMLRWDYQSGCISGGNNADCGCFVCHTAKDAF